MKLISCDECASVLDADKMPFPSDIWHEDGYVDNLKADYNHRTKTYSAFAFCPVCKAHVLKPES